VEKEDFKSPLARTILALGAAVSAFIIALYAGLGECRRMSWHGGALSAAPVRSHPWILDAQYLVAQSTMGRSHE
jgi:hypothetical protein